MVKPASISRYSLSLAGLALLCASQPAFAQSKPAATDAKPESEEAVFIPIEYRPPPYRVAIGVRLAGNAKVKFSGVGSIGNSSFPRAEGLPAQWKDEGPLPRDAAVNRSYDRWGASGADYVDRSVTVDSELKEETTADRTTNIWAFTSTDQVVADPNYPGGEAIKYQTNWLTSGGSTVSAESGKSMAWDIEISRELGGNKRFSWGLLFGAGLSDFKTEQSATVKATLHTLTDTYSLKGRKAPRKARTDEQGNPVLDENKQPIFDLVPYVSDGPELWIQALNEDKKTLKFEADGITPYLVRFTGDVAYPTDVTPAFKWFDSPLRLADTPFDRSFTETAGVDVMGTWKVRGSFLTARFGPFFAANLGNRFTVRASAGLTFTVLGARMTFQEKYFHPVLKNYLSIDTDQSSNESRVFGNLGYFATGELEWRMTQRTGLFIAATHEDYLRKAKIQIGEQIAELETSTGTALRAGVSARF